jgi:hypothetical protein
MSFQQLFYYLLKLGFSSEETVEVATHYVDWWSDWIEKEQRRP